MTLTFETKIEAFACLRALLHAGRVARLHEGAFSVVCAD